jgi:glycosyltransferase involved in cell wall biosynthesis
MKVMQVVPRITERAAGPSESVPGLSLALSRIGVDTSIWTLDGRPSGFTEVPVKVFPSARVVPRLGISSEMFAAMKREIREYEILHNHSLWMMPNVYPGWLPMKMWTRGKLIVSPRGTLGHYAWRRSFVRKQAMWAIGQRKTVQRAAALHATSLGEYQEIRSRRIRAPVAIIPNGVTIPRLKHSTVITPRTLLFLARIDPKKGIDILLRAWAMLADNHEEWHLDIVGPDNHGHLVEMQRLAASLQVPRVHFRGALYGSDKERAFQEASLYILPTHNENFGISVAESLANGTPVITTHGTPWDGLHQHKCGWWIERSVDSVAAVLSEAFSLEATQLHEMGLRGRAWMDSDFGWQAIGSQMKAFYEWVLGSGVKPEYVIEN